MKDGEETVFPKYYWDFVKAISFSGDARTLQVPSICLHLMGEFDSADE